MSTILAFETATHACSVALQHENSIFSRFEIAPRQHAKLLLPMIQSILSEAKIVLSHVQAIAFGCGPGSFMGVRLATGMAQGLALGLHIPVIPISTLQILAQTAYEKIKTKTIVVGWDARMDSIYWGIYTADQHGAMQAQIPDTLSDPKSVDTHLIPTIPCCFVGNAWSVYHNNFPSDFFQGRDQYPDIYPDATAMLTIANLKYQLHDVVSPENAHPQYLRNRVTHE